MQGRDVSCSVDEIVTCARLVGRQGSTHGSVDNTVGRHWRGGDGSGGHRPLSPWVILARSWGGQRPVGLATSRHSTGRPHSLSATRLTLEPFSQLGGNADLLSRIQRAEVSRETGNAPGTSDLHPEFGWATAWDRHNATTGERACNGF